MKRNAIWILLFVALAAASEPKPGFKLGDRLEPGAGKSARTTYAQTKWEELLPPGWDPFKDLKALDLGALRDGDPRTQALLDRLREEWNRAPVNAKLKGARIRIPGFIVPLESSGGAPREFLLVPYFGACIHTPPPPANQIIHAFAEKPLTEARSMNAVWAEGVLDIEGSATSMGYAGYRMKVHAVTPYTRR